MHDKITQTVIAGLSISVVLTFLSCQRELMQGTEPKPADANAPVAEDIKTPEKFGVYYATADGQKNLEGKPVVAGARPSFLIYQENLPEAERVRLRFHHSSPSGFIIDAGTLTSSSDEKSDAKGPSPEDYRSVFIFRNGEEHGVFEPAPSAIQGRKDLLRAAYAGDLKPGEYVAFSFIDESAGDKRWEKARFKYVGQFTVK